MSDRPVSDPFSLAGRRIVVTGASGGVGGSIAESIARAGGDVCLLARPENATERESAEALATKCGQLNVAAEIVLADFSQPVDQWLPRLKDDIDRRFGRVDGLCNNAGVCVDRDFLEVTAADFDLTFDVNVRAGFFLTQSFARDWVRDGIDGRVVFTGSINGLLSEDEHVAYDASKGAVAAMVRSLSVSLAGRGIRVNAMAPGLVRTPLTSAAIDQPEFNRWMRHHTPNGRVPSSDVCGDTVVFLLSDAATHIHGQTIYVDGGMSALQQPMPMSSLAADAPGDGVS